MEIKGIREGLLVKIESEEWSEARESLISHIEQQGDFLIGARLALDVGDKIIKAAEIGKLRDVLSDKGISLWALIGSSIVTETNAQALGLATKISKPIPGRLSKSNQSNRQGQNTISIQRTLRSGNTINYDGNVLIIGDVNPGAEIVASGNIVVWGRLRGMVHAGADGDEDAVVCALELSPTQLRISGEISLPPDIRKEIYPEVARLINGQIVAYSWDEKRTRRVF